MEIKVDTKAIKNRITKRQLVSKLLFSKLNGVKNADEA